MKRNINKSAEIVEIIEDCNESASHLGNHTPMLSPSQLRKSYAAPVVTVRDGRVVASSLDVARFFRKRHTNVLRCIDVIRRNTGADRLTFEPISYADKAGRPQRAFNMNKKGFSLLVLGFTGPKALAFRDAYTDRFEKMEAALQAAPAPVVPAIPQNYLEAMRVAVAALERAEAAESVLHRFSTASGLIGQKRASKALGITLRELGSLLTETFRWGYRDGANRLTACVDAQSAGLLKERAGVSPAGYAYVSACLTPKALKILAEYLCKPLTDAEIAALLTGPDAAND